MSKDTDKLAAQMRNLKPSKTSRAAGMEAAMAAFDAEFATETSADSADLEKNATPTQGLTDAPRPTGTPTKMVRVKTKRVETMSKFTSIFQKPQAMMMAGTCSAALIAALIVVPNMDDFGIEAPLEVVAPVEVDQTAEAPVVIETPPAIEDVTADMDTAPEPLQAPADDKTAATNANVNDGNAVPKGQPESPAVPDADEIVVTGTILKRNEFSSAPPLEVVEGDVSRDLGLVDSADLLGSSPEAAAPAPAPIAQGDITSVDSLLSDIKRNAANVEAGNKQREQQFRQRAAQQLASTPPPAPQIEREMPPGNPMPQVQFAPGFTASNVGQSQIALSANKVPSAPPLATLGGLTLEEVPAEYTVETKEIVTKEATIEFITTPPEYETVTESVVTQEASTELVTIPPSFNPDGTVKTPARTVERTVPAVTKMETRRVIKTPASTVERHVPAGTKRKVKVRTQISPQKFYLRDEDGKIVREFDSRDAFEKYKLNTTTAVSEAPVSTFSVDVDTASYSFLRASINRGQLPPRESIRLEEMINYFPYDYEAPKSADEPFKANVTVTQNPWNADTKLMHIGIKGYVPKQTEKPRSNLVFLIDTSGSMNQPNKLPLLINSFKLLLNTLDEDDTVSIVAYASASGTVLEPTPVSKKSDILDALNNLRAGGSTAGAAGLELAYQKAQESFYDEGVNRVILATDGDFNVGFSSPDDMKDFIKDKRETGIFLSVLGFGMGNYNDHLMQSLAQNGNGVAAYIDTLSEANKVLANEAGSALFTIAKDVKIQVEFNPATIAEYRLIGYETRALKRQDFNNDKVDAGEIGAGHSVTAIYEMTPVGSPAITIDKLRYASAEDTPKNNGSDEYAFVKIRHKLPDADKSTLQTFPIGKRQERRLSRASDDMRFATAVSIVGQKLRGDMQVDDYSYADAIKLAQGAKGEDENGYRAEFIRMVKLIEAMEE